MKKVPILVTAGSLTLAVFFGIRLADAQRQLAVRTPGSVDGGGASATGVRDGVASSPSFHPGGGDPSAPATMGPTKRDRSEIIALRQEIARLRSVIDERDSPGLLLESTGRVATMTTGDTDTRSFILPPPLPQAIEHWTGGDKRRWGHEQATGAPDTQQAGDIPTAWASKNPDGSVEWLKLDYAQAVDLQQINVLESHQPGAISKVAAIMPDGSERVVWEGTMDPSTENERVNTSFPVGEDIQAQSVKVYVDTSRVPGWNEIDAVELVGRDGSRQWATGSSASSSYADP